jgi:hypothetical protein
MVLGKDTFKGVQIFEIGRIGSLWHRELERESQFYRIGRGALENVVPVSRGVGALNDPLWVKRSLRGVNTEDEIYISVLSRG